MHQRKSTNARPSGTDGSDFSYRMVVDSRYQKVARGKSRLSKLLAIQVFIQILIAVSPFLLTQTGRTIDTLFISSTCLPFVSLLSGELGRKRSKSLLLKIYVFGSAVNIVLLLVSLAGTSFLQKVVQDPTSWQTPNLELLKVSVLFLGLIIQGCAIVTATSLIRNMAPPKKAS